MSLFDKMFKKNKLEQAIDQKMDDAVEFVAENNPVMRKVRATMEEGEAQVTRALEREIYKETGKLPEKRPGAKENGGDPFQKWDDMFDQLFEQELGSIKICPSCGEGASAELDLCPKCGAQLPKATAMEEVQSWKQSLKEEND